MNKFGVNVRWGITEVFWVLILRMAAVFILGRIILPFFPAISQQTLNILDRLILIALTLFFVFRVGTFKDLGLNRQQPGKDILIGLIGGTVILALTTGVQKLFIFYLAADINTNPLVAMAAQAETLSELAAPLFVGGIMTPIAEEIYYRGFALPAFAKRWGTAAGIIISALFFSLMHLSAVWFLEIALVGIGLAVIYYRTGSLLPGIVAHSFVNSARLLIVYLS